MNFDLSQPTYRLRNFLRYHQHQVQQGETETERENSRNVLLNFHRAIGGNYAVLFDGREYLAE